MLARNKIFTKLLNIALFFSLTACVEHETPFKATADGGEPSTQGGDIAPQLPPTNPLQPTNSDPGGSRSSDPALGDSNGPIDTGSPMDSDPPVDDTEFGGGQSSDPDSPNICTGCFINDICYSNNETNPSNGCQACDTSSSATAWTNQDGKSCNDNLFCTENDVCQMGLCQGTARDCNDGVNCNGVETCDDIADKCQKGETACDPGLFCNTGSDTCISTCNGCEIAGSCYEDRETNELDGCQICDVTQSKKEWTINIGHDCDDDNMCTENDQCTAEGKCEGTEVICDADADVCGKKATCLPEIGCESHYPGYNTSCNDGDECTIDDHCDGYGQCRGNTKPCGDEHECTEDTCSYGVCNHPLKPGYCFVDSGKNDGSRVCVGANYNADHDSCLTCDPTSNNAGWTQRTDVCRFNNQCFETGQHPQSPCLTCVNANWTLNSDNCYIDSVCRAEGATNGSNTCQYCDPSQPNQWTARSAGTSCNECQLCDNQGFCSDIVEDMCLIGGRCIEDGETNTGNECQQCDALNDPSHWSPVTPTTPCGDNPCTVCNDSGNCNVDLTPCCSTADAPNMTTGVCDGTVNDVLVHNGCVLQYDWEERTLTTPDTITFEYEYTTSECVNGNWQTPEITGDETECTDCEVGFTDHWYTVGCDVLDQNDTCDPPSI